VILTDSAIRERMRRPGAKIKQATTRPWNLALMLEKYNALLGSFILFALAQSRPIHSAPVPANVHPFPNSGHSLRSRVVREVPTPAALGIVFRSRIAGCQSQPRS
jgi:hypothetical protein